jgi:carboxyl-terminal processing protease
MQKVNLSLSNFKYWCINFLGFKLFLLVFEQSDTDGLLKSKTLAFRKDLFQKGRLVGKYLIIYASVLIPGKFSLMSIFQRGGQYLFLLVQILTVIGFVSVVPDVYADNLIQEIAEVIHTYHFKKPPKQEVLKISLEGLNDYLITLDPYSKYLSPDDNRLRKMTSRQGYVGVGTQIIRFQQNQTFLIPYRNGPAFQAGIRFPVILKTVNLTPVKIVTLPTVKKLLSGNTGSLVNLEVQLFDNRNTRKTFSVTRAVVDSPSIELIHDLSIPYIRLYQFVDSKTTPHLEVFLNQLKKAKYPIVIDLRYCPGGDFYEALDSASLFLPPKQLLATLEDKNSKTPLYSINRQKITDKVILLVSSVTASSAEVFAGALQHYQQGILIGQTTHGKCTSQSYIQLSNKGALLLARHRILDPNNQYCDGKGLRPDLSVTTENVLNTNFLISKGLQIKKNYQD